ncbi:transposase, partial [Acidiphilium sp.]|uniref:transposase n=1 Tax=Acidiphilium sp. TaxID=527 RepID=UPI00258E512F
DDQAGTEKRRSSQTKKLAKGSGGAATCGGGRVAPAMAAVPLAASRRPIQIVKRSDAASGFVLLPRRWVIERTFAWLSRCRRLAKDFEATVTSATAWLFLVVWQHGYNTGGRTRN